MTQQVLFWLENPVRAKMMIWSIYEAEVDNQMGKFEAAKRMYLGRGNEDLKRDYHCCERKLRESVMQMFSGHNGCRPFSRDDLQQSRLALPSRPSTMHRVCTTRPPGFEMALQNLVPSLALRNLT